MFIRGIAVDVPHPHHDGTRDVDDHQVIPPRDWEEYGKQVEASLENDQRIQISLGSTAASGTIVIAIGSMEVVESVAAVQERGNALCFVVGLSTLQQLRGALDAAISASSE